jgi:hemerythrin-like domain-containing protein
MLVTIGQTPGSNFDDPLGMLRDCHKRITYFLDSLAFAAKKFHGLPLPHEVRKVILNSLRYFREAAPRHNADEEKSLFPRMRSFINGKQFASALMQSLEGEHRWAESQHELVDGLFRKWIANGSVTLEESESLVSTLSQLQAFYALHIRQEELAIFPIGEEELSAAEIAAIGVEMAARRGVDFSPPE